MNNNGNILLKYLTSWTFIGEIISCQKLQNMPLEKIKYLMCNGLMSSYVEYIREANRDSCKRTMGNISYNVSSLKDQSFSHHYVVDICGGPKM